MLVIIVGKNRIEYCQVKKQNLDKHFFATRGQLYKVYPDTMRKIEIIEDGKKRTETCIIYPENGIRPYGSKLPETDEELSKDPYAMDRVLMNISEHKLAHNESRFGRYKGYFTSVSKNYGTITQWIPYVIAGVCVILAFAGVLS